MLKRGFTLIEMLTVITIIAILSGLMFISLRPDPAQAAVQEAAVITRAQIMLARSLALRTQQQHAVTFNITNADSGNVIRNFAPTDPESFPGRHWLSIIGPVPLQTAFQDSDFDENQSMNRPPQMGMLKEPLGSTPTRRTLPIFASKVERYQIGSRVYLPRGSRFLALSDWDGGYYKFVSSQYNPTNTQGGHFALINGIYPIPWFGTTISDPSGVRLIPWGFVDDTSEALARTASSGNNAYWLRSNVHSGFGANLIASVYDQPDGKHLVDGTLMDAVLNCKPDGSIEFDHWNRAKILTQVNPRLNSGSLTQPGMSWYSSYQCTEITGGSHITICRDVDDDDPYPTSSRAVFASESDALNSITPFVRVYVNAASGATEIRQGLQNANVVPRFTDATGAAIPIDQLPDLLQTLNPFCRVQLGQAGYTTAAGRGRGPYHLPSADPTVTNFVLFNQSTP